MRVCVIVRARMCACVCLQDRVGEYAHVFDVDANSVDVLRTRPCRCMWLGLAGCIAVLKWTLHVIVSAWITCMNCPSSWTAAGNFPQFVCDHYQTQTELNQFFENWTNTRRTVVTSIRFANATMCIPAMCCVEQLCSFLCERQMIACMFLFLVEFSLYFVSGLVPSLCAVLVFGERICTVCFVLIFSSWWPVSILSDCLFHLLFGVFKSAVHCVVLL